MTWKVLPSIVCICFTLMITSSAMGQSADGLPGGVLEGTIRDSAANKPLPAATVAIYRHTDSSLVRYMLTNQLGGFRMTGLLLGAELDIIVSYTGYMPRRLRVTFREDQERQRLGTIRLSLMPVDLEGITVQGYRPPVQMNGDTLEFNASAFKLGETAVVEDLIRRLPGVYVWGDGKITVNGRVVHRVLVDKKPFFGGDAKIALQNLPKTSVDKVQVYKDTEASRNALDSIMIVNIQLRKDKNAGFFGKAGGGYGTDHRYATDAVAAGFTPRTQLSLAGAANNTNILAPDVASLMRLGSFKGTTVAIENQPDFSVEGRHDTRAAGLNFQHDFTFDPSNRKISRLTSDYFIKRHDQVTRQQTETLNWLDGGGQLKQESIYDGNSSETGHVFNAKMERREDDWEWNNAIQLQTHRNENYFMQSNLNLDEGGGMGSDNTASSRQRFQNDDISLTGKVFSRKTGIRSEYTFQLGRDAEDQENRSEFNIPGNPAAAQYFDRKTEKDMKSASVDWQIKYDLTRWFKGAMGPQDELQLVNTLRAGNDRTNRKTRDIEQGGLHFQGNDYLTYKTKYGVLDETAGLSYYKRFQWGFPQRTRNVIGITASALQQFYRQRQFSARSELQFEKTYGNFVPRLGVNFYKERAGRSATTINLEISRSAGYASAEQLTALRDSASLYGYRVGNPRVRPSRSDEINLRYYYSNQFRSAWINTGQLNVRAGKVKDVITDSIFYDTNWRLVGQSVNLDKSWFLQANGSIHKGIRFGNNELMLETHYYLSLLRQPRYLSHVLQRLQSASNHVRMTVTYTLQDKVVFQAAGSVYSYGSRNNGTAEAPLHSTQWKTVFSTGANFLKYFNASSQLSYNVNTSSFSERMDYNIWNASLSCRFPANRKMEVRISALDILHQNTGVINRSGINYLSVGTVNMLQQYYMLTLAYYPRYFGKRKVSRLPKN